VDGEAVVFLSQVVVDIVAEAVAFKLQTTASFPQLRLRSLGLASEVGHLSPLAGITRTLP